MQKSVSDFGYTQAREHRQSRRDRFLAEIEACTPWDELVATLEEHYPKSGKRGRPPMGLERMLRMHIAQNCFGLSDEGIEDAIYDSFAIRRFVGVDLGRDPVPAATTLLKFRRLLEASGLTERIFQTIRQHLASKGLIMREGTIVDASLIAAPPSTKNRDKQRDSGMHQAKKGNQWHFGMKLHIGTDADSGLGHTGVTTAAKVSDVTEAGALLHGEEKDVYGDAGYQGVEKRAENQDRDVSWHVAMRPSKRRALPQTPKGQILDQVERVKLQIRSKVEHPFHVLRNLLAYRKTRYRGLAKNTAHLNTLMGLASLKLAAKRLLRIQGSSASIA